MIKVLNLLNPIKCYIATFLVALVLIPKSSGDKLNTLSKKFKISETMSLEVRVGAEIEYKTSYRIYLVEKDKQEKVMAGWVKDLTYYKAKNLPIPVLGVFPGLAIIDAKNAGDILGMIVVFRGDLYIVAADLKGEGKFEHFLVRDIDPFLIKVPTLDVLLKDRDSVRVKLKNGREYVIKAVALK